MVQLYPLPLLWSYTLFPFIINSLLITFTNNIPAFPPDSPPLNVSNARPSRKQVGYHLPKQTFAPH